MKTLIVGVAWHDGRVKRVVDNLQENGYEVIEIKRTSRSWLGGMFGEDVTEITYIERTQPTGGGDKLTGKKK